MELDLHKRGEVSDDVYLKLCGNNARVTSYRLQDADLPPILAAICGVPIVTMLDLRYNRLTDEGAMTIGAFLKADKFLKELNLMGNDIGEEGALAISEGLKINRTLLILKMTGNQIKSKGGVHLAHALQVNDKLQYIDVGQCDQDITSCIAFLTVLRKNSTLLGINLDRPLLFTIQEEPTVHVKEMLCINKTLKEIHLSKLDMRDFGAERIAEAMERNRSLQVLDISVNRIARDGALALSKILPNHPSLTVLDLSYNRIQCAGAIAIAEALRNDDNRLKVLCVAYNELKPLGLRALGKMMFKNDTIQCIYIWGNEFNDEVCEIFSQLLLIGRLTEDCTDVRPYKVDGHTYLGMLNHDCDYRRYRFAVPWWKSQAPTDRSIALF
nr:unnamed protein product [Spirometra erinaceieuropaei]